MNSETEIKEMNWHELHKDIPESFSMLISAPRRSGKTWILKDIMHMLGLYYKWDIVILYSDTAKYNDDYDYVPERFKMVYDPEHLANVIEQQSNNMIAYKKNKSKNKERPPKILILMDDCISDGSKLIYDKYVAMLYVMGRHLQISSILLSQHIGAVSNKVKKNSDVMLFFRNPDKEATDLLRKRYMHLFNEDKKEIEHIIDRKIYTEPYTVSVVCIYKIQHAKRIDDYIYKYKAPENPPPPFRLGQLQYWRDEPVKTNDDPIKKYRGVDVHDDDLKKVFKKFGNDDGGQEITISRRRKKK